MKKFLALLLIIVTVVFCFAACGETVEDDGNTNGGGNNGDATNEFGGSNFTDMADGELPAIPIEPDALS